MSGDKVMARTAARDQNFLSVREDGFVEAVPINAGEAETFEGTDAAGEPVKGSFEALGQLFGAAGAPR